MENLEKLGVFYLGREYDLENKKLKENFLLYDSKDLVTHAVCVGMTGSGKTGLCIDILEEAVMDGIPSVVVDPKGDMSNLLLTFPKLEADDFLPWINPDEAQKKNLTPHEYAAGQAALWKKGLAEWKQDGERIRRLRESAEFAVYTPGSSAGLPVSILKSFAAPEKVIIDDSDMLRERINTTVTSLLNLLGIEADPVKSREHILLSTILDLSWKGGEDLDLAGLIQAIQTPSVSRIGFFDLESFFPSEDRYSLAMKLNNLLAAPGFQPWLEGEPLNMDRMFYTGEGKPRVSIFSIAHLNDAERMFFVSLFLTQLLGWTRAQTGTSSLRALFYMDEIFGYFPPVANPPSKAPLLTLLKQARAFGLGILLATQNPVDLDYKGLSNTGTWFLGRLQTERDKERVLDGLEGVGSSAGGRFDRRRIEKILTSLGKRIFLMNNVHEDEPVIFQTRWAMSYLRGPLTREQIKKLMHPVKSLSMEPAPAAAATESSGPLSTTGKKVSGLSERPILPPGIPQYFMPVGGSPPDGSALFYQPMILGMSIIYYANARIGVAVKKEISFLADLSAKINWDQAKRIEVNEADLDQLPEDEESLYGDLPQGASRVKNYQIWSEEFIDWLYHNQKLELFKSPSLDMISDPGENERDFRIRLQQAAHEKRDRLIERLRKKYAVKIESIQQQINRAELAVGREKEQAKQQKLQTMISFGATLFTSMLGRKRVSQSTLGRAATTVQRAGRIFKESKDIERAKEKLEKLYIRLDNLKAGLEREIAGIRASVDPLNEELDTLTIRAKKIDIAVPLFALTWVPFWRDSKGGIRPSDMLQ